MSALDRHSLALFACASALLLGAREARAGRCMRALSGPRMPVALNLEQGDWGTGASPCSFNEVTVTAAAQLLLDTPHYYGTLQAEAAVHGTFAFSDRAWISAGYMPIRYRFVQNASLIASELESGPLTLGIHGALLRGEHWQLAPWARFYLPVETGTRYSSTSGFEPGVAVVWGPSSYFSLISAVNLPIALSFIGVQQFSRIQFHHSLDLVWTPVTWFELVAGAELRLGFSAANALDYLAPKAALRLWAGRTFLVQLAAMMPLGGVERSQARVTLTLGAVGF